MHEKTAKISFWMLAVVVLALAFIPSTILVSALQQYRHFVSGFDPGVLRPVKIHSVPHSASASPDNPNLEFIEFKLRAPKAKQVYLVGEFNAWKDGTMALLKRPGGSWEISLPLPPGRYHYRYIVDGQAQIDPENRQSENANGDKASVREVLP